MVHGARVPEGRKAGSHGPRRRVLPPAAGEPHGVHQSRLAETGKRRKESQGAAEDP